MQLFPHQDQFLTDVRGAFRAGHRRVLAVAPTGMGKTLCGATMASGAVTHGSRVLFAAGRRELIRQTVTTFARCAGLSLSDDQPLTEVVEALTRTDAPVRVIQASNDLGPPDAPIIVGSVQTLSTPRWLGALPQVQFGILDECFPTGTLVDGRPIEELRVGDLVCSFDHASGRIEPRPIRRLFVSQPAALVTVHLDDGRAVTCTAGHPFFTGASYVAALHLEPGDVLYGGHDHDAMYQLRNDGGDHRQTKARHGAALRARVLLDSLSRYGALAREIDPHGEHQSSPCEQAHDRAQPDAARSFSPQDATDVARDRASADGARRQRNRPIADGAATTPGVAVGMGLQLGCPDKAVAWQRISASLQDRPGTSDEPSCGGDRREEPRVAGPPRTGCQEAGITRIARVVRVEIHERRGADGFGALCRDDLVYNIEVEGNHNYFVDGILVHNCHHSPAATWSDIIRSHPDARWIGLSATPERGDGKPLDLFDALVPGPSVRQLTELGYLVPCRTWAGPATLKPGELALQPLEAYQRHAGGQRTAVFCRDRAHARAELAVFQAAGVPVAIVTGDMPDRARDAALAAWRAGEVLVVLSVNVLTEGFDMPELGVAILARRFNHLGPYLQAGGRIIRVAPGKVGATLIDLTGCAHEHGPLEADRDFYLTGTATSVRRSVDSFGQCKACGTMFLYGPRTCPHCGAEISTQPAPAPRSVNAGVAELCSAPPRTPWVSSLRAKHDGTCRKCGRWFPRGTLIFHTSGQRNSARHQTCPAPALPSATGVHP